MQTKEKYYKNAINLNKENTVIGVTNKGYGKTHIVQKPIKKNQVVVQAYGSPLTHQTAHYSIQIGKGKHILPRYWTGRFWNHSCNPNTYARSNKDGFIELVALRDIKAGEEVTYSYWMSELEWVKSASESTLSCLCKSKDCRKKILSFSQLTQAEQKKVQKSGQCSNFILTLKIPVQV